MRKTFHRILIVLIALASAACIAVSATFAYFSGVISLTDDQKPHFAMIVSELFGELDNPPNPGAKWGTEGNPYVIATQKHYSNLYHLQNSGASVITEDTYFQVSTEAGTPVYIGGSSTNASDMLEVQAIGTEAYPFVSNIKGVNIPTAPITLPNGMQTTASTIGNVKVVVDSASQIDIGLFGTVGTDDYERETDAAGNVVSVNPIGSIQNLLLYNVQIDTQSTGTPDYTKHKHYGDEAPFETNHIGILVGHAQGCTINNISVYYEQGSVTVPNEDPTIEDSPTAKINAFNINATNAAKYTSSGGIIGHYNDIVVPKENYPVSSSGNYSDEEWGGGTESGYGEGVVYAADIWGKTEKTAASYPLQATFGTGEGELYHGITNKTYFRDGVFSFAHSTDASNDSVRRLWDFSSQGTTIDDFRIPHNPDDYDLVETGQSTYAELWSYTQVTGTVSTGNNRYVVVSIVDDKEYVLLGQSASGNRLQSRELTFDQGKMVIPYDASGSQTNKYSFVYDGAINFKNGSANSYLIPTSTTIELNTSGSKPNQSDVKFALDNYNNQNTANARYYIRGSTGQVGDIGFVIEGSGHYYRGVEKGSATTVYKIYQLTGTAQEVEYELSTMEVAKDENGELKPNEKFDLTEKVLFYTGNSSGSTAESKYRYNIETMSDLKWRNKAGFILRNANASLDMAASINYKGTSNGSHYELQNLVSAQVDNTTFNVPKGSVAFKVNGTGIANDEVPINIIVATRPDDDRNQSIICSKILNTGWTNGTSTDSTASSFVTEQARFPLPPLPSGTTHTPIYISNTGITNTTTIDGTQYAKAYPNYSVMLIAYTFNIPCTNNGYYSMAADQGSTSFVFFSVGSTASGNTKNPNHENQLFFTPLSGIDFVFHYTDTSSEPHITQIATVSSAIGTEYFQSLVTPYFGIESFDPVDPVNSHLVVTTKESWRLSFNIYRRRDAEKTGAMYIYGRGTAESISYTDGSYYKDGVYGFSDVTVVSRSSAYP